ncbi:hypothetical protein LTR49_026833 [Elasticomyces elasticus]|nr:hypothetical protein LTR49_026833 [Elasticomyces elasticus]
MSNKCIVCHKSDFSRKATKEGGEGSISLIEPKAAGKNDDDIAEDDPEAIRLMEVYLYLGDYAPNSMMNGPRYDLSTKTSDNLVELRVNAQQTPSAGVMDGVQVEQLKDHGRMDNVGITSTDARNDVESRCTNNLKGRKGKARLAA